MAVLDEQKRARAEQLLGLVRELRSLTVRLAADATDLARQRTWEHGQLQQAWEQKFVEILRELYRMTLEQTPARPIDADFSGAANQIVDALERHGEYKVARDRVGDGRYHEARRNLATKFIGFAQSILMAMRTR